MTAHRVQHTVCNCARVMVVQLTGADARQYPMGEMRWISGDRTSTRSFKSQKSQTPGCRARAVGGPEHPCHLLAGSGTSGGSAHSGNSPRLERHPVHCRSTSTGRRPWRMNPGVSHAQGGQRSVFGGAQRHPRGGTQPSGHFTEGASRRLGSSRIVPPTREGDIQGDIEPTTGDHLGETV